MFIPTVSSAQSPAPAPTNTVAPVVDSSPTIHVDFKSEGRAISPTLWGIFFEDINFGADGGLYAEMVKNRSFEFPDPMTGWIPLGPEITTGKMSVGTAEPFTPSSPHYLRIETMGNGGYTEKFGIANEGFRGMGARLKECCRFSAQIRQVSGASKLRIELVGSDGTMLAKTELQDFGKEWKEYSADLMPTKTDAKAKLMIFVEGRGTLDLDMVSLFPDKTWKNRPGGLRADLVQLLADLKPGFMRFPGGCIVEGPNLEKRYRWKDTLPPPAERKTKRNRWNDESPRRVTPDYFQSFGLGFFEYFLLCEDIGASPLPILNCGMACQFNTGEVAPMDQLNPYIQDALDLIEFANGPADSPWGSRRVAMGHPAPFGLKYLGIGNENWGPAYIERFAAFQKAIKAKYPEIKLVASAGAKASGDMFNLAWEKFREMNADIVDEHSYLDPDWFYDAAKRYDNYPRTGPKVCVGEYAAHGKGQRNDWASALAEAAFMTGLERNADVVVMSAYAPLLAHVEAWQWKPDLIWFDNLRSVGTSNYEVQKIFSTNTGDTSFPVQTTGTKIFASATADQKSGEIILKLVNSSPDTRSTSITLDGVANLQSEASVITLAGNLGEENTLDNPKRIAPRETRINIAGASFPCSLPPFSVSVIRLKGQPQARIQRPQQ